MTTIAPRSELGEQGPASVDPARATADQLAAAVLVAIHRVAKQSTLYEDENETRIRQLQATQEAVRTYGTRTGRNFSAFWMQQSVFIGRRLLRAGRNIYAAALEVAEILRPLGIAQIVVGFDVPMEELKQLQEIFRALQRHQKPPVELLTFTRIRLRRSPDLDKRFVDEQGLSPRELAARCYAKTVVVVRRLFEDVQKGTTSIPIRVRRASQQLVDAMGTAGSELLAMAVVHNARTDDASRAVNTAIVATMMARELGGDPRLLARIATAALLCDLGIPRVAGTGPTGEAQVGGFMPRLGEQQIPELPAATAALVTMLDGVSDTAVIHATLTYEALHLQWSDRLEAAYGGLRQPTVAGRLLAMARRFTALNSAVDVDPPLSVAEIMTALQLGATEPAELGAFRVLASVLQIYPTGALVELSTGEVAQVLHTPSDPTLFAKPVVGVLLDERGTRLPQRRELALARPAADGRDVQVARVLALPDEAQLRAAWEGQEALRRPVAPEPPPVVEATAPAAGEPGPKPPARGAAPARASRSGPPPLPPQASAPPQTTPGPPTQPSPAPAGAAAPSSPSVAAAPLSRAPRSAPAAPAGGGERKRVLAPPDFPVGDDGQPLAPTASGTLQEAPLMDLVLYLTQHHFSGSLDLVGPGDERFVLYFDRGRPAKAYSRAQVAPLDRVLVELKLLDFERLQRSIMAIAKSGQLHGEHLVAEGVLSRLSLLEALRAQVVHKARAMFQLGPETKYTVYDRANLLDDYGGPELTPSDPLRVVMAGVRARPHCPEIEATLARLGDRPVSIDPSVAIDGLGLVADEQRIEALLRKRACTLEDLFAELDVDINVVRMTLYALYLAGALLVSDEPDRPAPASPPEGAAAAES